MKGFFFSLLLICLGGGGLFGQSKSYYAPPFIWPSARAWGQGNSFVANGTGFDVLLVNPASYTRNQEVANKAGEKVQKGETMFLSLGAAYSGTFNALRDERYSNIGEILIHQMGLSEGTPKGLFGFGYLGKGWGIGLLGSAYSARNLSNPKDGLGVANFTFGLSIGYAYDLELSNFSSLSFGIAFRTMYRIILENLNAIHIFGGPLDLEVVDGYAGIGFGLDLGVNYRWRPFTFSLVVKDVVLSPLFMNSLEVFPLTDIPLSGRRLDGNYSTPMSIHVGGAYKLFKEELRSQFNATAHFSFSLPINLSSYENSLPLTTIDRLGVGLELSFLSSLFFRIGATEGYFTTGLGMDLSYINISVGVSLRRVNRYGIFNFYPHVGASLKY